MSTERYRVTVAGGGGKAVASGTNLGVLVPKALDLARDGWTSFVKNTRGSVVEIRCRPDGVHLDYHRADGDYLDATTDGHWPDWAQRVRAMTEQLT